MNHICNFWLLHDYFWCVYSGSQIWQKLFHKVCNYGFWFCDWFPCELLILSFHQIFCYTHCIQNFSLHHEQYRYVGFCSSYLRNIFRIFHIGNYSLKFVEVNPFFEKKKELEKKGLNLTTTAFRKLNLHHCSFNFAGIFRRIPIFLWMSVL